jgi:hypothetical protein
MNKQDKSILLGISGKKQATIHSVSISFSLIRKAGEKPFRLIDEISDQSKACRSNLQTRPSASNSANSPFQGRSFRQDW